MGWTKVEDTLPELDVWVQVYEDDDDNPQDAFIGKMLDGMYPSTEHFRQRVVPAKLEYIDSEGYARWFLCYVGASSLRHTRNVTHWKPMSDGPVSE